MKRIQGFDNRAEHSEILYRSEGFTYRIDHLWAKWPEELIGVHVLNARCDEEDNLFAATDNKDHPVVLFDREGNFIRSFGKGLFGKAHSIFLTDHDTILVADTSDHVHAVREITKTGKIVRDFGNLCVPSDSGCNDDAFMQLKRDGKIPVDAPWDEYVEFYARLDSITRAAPPFNKPCEMAVAPNGMMFAADGYGNAAVQVFSPQGEYLETWGGPGTEVGQYRLPHGVCIDKYNRIWVADRENKRGYIYNMEGEILAVLQGNFFRISAMWTDDNYAYIAELDGGFAIIGLDDLELKAQFGYYESNLRTHGICGDSKGNLFLMTNRTNRYSNIVKMIRVE
ncbi:MAG: hypothetical protein DBX44_03770 [Oscillospiraceae bacterium]|nr:MAG: hypothetical protein DBX44_03770 [Oscillospiraceae bacterium]